MSLFSTITTLAATTLLENYTGSNNRPIPNPGAQGQPPGHFPAGRGQNQPADQLPSLSDLSLPSPSEHPRLPPLRRPSHQQQQQQQHLEEGIEMPPATIPNSIWQTMSYPIPRGPCLQKSTIISACSCQRFMVHPLKATTSFDCDGCGHHASFHKMKSDEEEVESAAKWRERQGQGQMRGVEGGNNERRMITSQASQAEYNVNGSRRTTVIEVDDDDDEGQGQLDGDDEETIYGGEERDGDYVEPGRKRGRYQNEAGRRAVVAGSSTAAGKRKR